MTNQPRPKNVPFKRVLLKISGESLMGHDTNPIDPEVMNQLVNDISQIHRMGVQLSLVVGGGNILRGSKVASAHLDRETADLMGMLGTVMNGLALAAAVKSANIPVKVVSILHMPQVAKTYERSQCLHDLENNQVLVFVAGTGAPYFTTDTAAVLRALEMNCDVVMKGTQVDGVYSDDPKTNPHAKYFATLDYQEVLDHNLRVMDMTAITLAKENRIPILVFNIGKKGMLLDIIQGHGTYTLIRKEEK